MIFEAINYYTLWHIIGALVLGLLLGLIVKRMRVVFAFAISIPIIWEFVERIDPIMELLASWTNSSKGESFINTISDVAFGIAFILVGYYISSRFIKKKR